MTTHFDGSGGEHSPERPSRAPTTAPAATDHSTIRGAPSGVFVPIIGAAATDPPACATCGGAKRTIKPIDRYGGEIIEPCPDCAKPPQPERRIGQMAPCKACGGYWRNDIQDCHRDERKQPERVVVAEGIWDDVQGVVYDDNTGSAVYLGGIPRCPDAHNQRVRVWMEVIP